MNENDLRPPRNLAASLAVAFITMSVAALVISGAVGILFLVQTQNEAIAGKQRVVAHQAADAVAEFVRDKFSVMETAVRLTKTDQERERAMQSLLGLEPAFRQLLFLDTGNEERFRVSRMTRTASERLDEQLGDDPFSRVSAGGRHIGSVYVDQVTSEPLVIMSVPVTTVLGDMLGILVAEVNLKFIWQLVDRLQVGETGHAYVVDRQGRLIAFGDTGRVLRGETLGELRDVADFMAHSPKEAKNDASIFTGISGNRVVGTYVALGTPDWAVMTELPVNEAYRQVFRNSAVSGLILLAMSALAGWLGLRTARRLATPIVDLTRIATRISDGEPDVRAAVKGPAEVLHLAEAFNKMTRRLGLMLDREVERTRALEEEISQRKEIQKALEESDSILRATLESTHDGVLVADGSGRISHYNKQFARIWNIPDNRLATLDDKVLIDYVLPQVVDPEQFTKKIEQLYHSLNPSEDALRLKDGRILERSSYPLMEKNRENGRVWFFRDVTKRKQAETALIESENRLRNLTANFPGVVIQFRTTRDHVYTNEFLSAKTADIFGLELNSETILDEFYRHIPDEEKEAYAASMRDAIDSVRPWTYEGRFNRPDGETIWFSGHAEPHEEGDTIVYYGILMDITSRKVMETSLRLARYIVEKADIAIFILDENGGFLDVNEEACRYLGYSREELGKMDVFDVDLNFTPDGWAGHMKELRSHGVKIIETQNRRKDGTMVTIQVIDNVMTFEDREFHVAFVQDITERKRAEESLRLTQFIFDRAPIGIWRMGEKGEILDVNEEGCTSLGYGKEELCRMKVFDFDPNFNPDVWADNIATLDASGTSTIESLHRRKNGEIFPIQVIQNRVQFEGQMFHVAFVQDITERKQAEAALRNTEKRLQQSQKMEAIGVLAGGIAHDFNNILSAVLGYAELAKLSLENRGKTRGRLDEIIGAGMRARDLVRQILTFARQADIKKAPVAVDQLMRETLKFLRASLPASIDIRRKSTAADGTTFADPTQVHQVLMNLCANAAHAMEKKGGVLDIRLEDASEADDPALKALKPGRYLKLTVSDTGCGIPEEVIDKIFDPFFTTKDRGEGTGMGLSVVHGIVEDMGGAISVRSKPGEGATFHVFLPRYEGREMSAEGTDMSAGAGSGKILFVDDEKTIVTAGRGILEHHGYQVAAATNPLEALEMFRAAPGEFDLVLTDMTMPGMTGIELSGKLLEIRPDIPIVLFTGFNPGITPEKVRAAGIRNLVMKPMVARELIKAVQSALDSDSGRE